VALQTLFDLLVGLGVNPHWLRTTPFHGDCKVWSEGRIRPPQENEKSKFVVKSLQNDVRHYSDLSPNTLFVMADVG